MSNTPHQSSDSDIVVMMIAGMLALGAVGTFLTGAGSKVLDWAVTQQVLLPVAAAPLVAIPGAGGAGLDLRRLAIAAAVALVVLAVLGRSIARSVRSRRNPL